MKITVQNYRRSQTKHRKVEKGHGWTKLERTEMDQPRSQGKRPWERGWRWIGIWVKLACVAWRFLSYLNCLNRQATQAMVKLKNVGPPFFKFMSVYIKTSFTQRENHFQLLCGLDFANERLALPICRLELIIDKIKQNYLK